MRTFMPAAALALGFAAPALAGEGSARCTATFNQEGVPSGTIQKNLEGLGYRVNRIETEHGCYEVRAVNDSGFQIKAIYHPVTGELVQARLR